MARPKRAFIWMVRHGEAEGNKHRMLNGNRVDASLTDKGHAQARGLAKRWPWKPDAIITSPLTRATATAWDLADRFKMKLVFCKLVEEQDYGEFSGHTLDEMMGKEEYRSCFHTDETSGQVYTIQTPGGESWEDVKKRAARFLKWADGKYSGMRIVVVSHSDFINVVYGVRFGLSDDEIFRRQDVPNCKAVRL